MARRSRPRLSRARGPQAVPAVYSGRVTPSDSAYASGYASEEEEEVAPAKFDVNTIPMDKLTLEDSAENAEAAEAAIEAEAVAESATTADTTSAAAAAKEVVPTAKVVPAAKAAPAAKAVKPFRFLDLPSELRVRVYAYHFATPDLVMDLSPENYKTVHRKLALLRTSRRVYLEASHYFYSTRIFRVFPTYPGRFFKTRRPLLARLAPAQRRHLVALELRLGPGFSKPPKGWAVTDKLGLDQCVHVRRLHVFVQLDPSLSFLDGFRQAGFYEAFSAHLLDGILAAAPGIDVVEFDAFENVRKNCPIMTDLVQTARDHAKKIAWGPAFRHADDDAVRPAEPPLAPLRGFENTIVAWA